MTAHLDENATRIMPDDGDPEDLVELSEQIVQVFKDAFPQARGIEDSVIALRVDQPGRNALMSTYTRASHASTMEAVQMKRQKIRLSARVDTDEALEQVAARVGQALNCTFDKGEFQRRNAQVAYVFGLKLSLVTEYGVGDKKVAKLVGSVTEKGLRYAPDGSGLAEFDRVDISAYLVDLLTIRTRLLWYQPTPEDYAAEQRAGRGIDDWHGGVGARGWTGDDEEKFGGR